jgi:hypothetical protein
MSDPYELWCYIQGDHIYFPVEASSNVSIGKLKEQIFAEGTSKDFAGCSAKDLTLTKVCYIMISM